MLVGSVAVVGSEKKGSLFGGQAGWSEPKYIGRWSTVCPTWVTLSPWQYNVFSQFLCYR